MKPKHLIFDCGGVLVYPRLGDWKLPFGAQDLLGERFRDLQTEKYRRASLACADWLDEARLIPDIAEERRLRRSYIRALDHCMGWHMTDDEIDRLGDDFTDNIERYGLFDDVRPWLERWKHKYSLGVLSDAMPSILEFMKRFGIYEPFDALVISCHIGAIKPSPRMYAAILGALDARPEDCLFVDDRAVNLEGAVAAGMRAVQMARAEFPPAELWNGPVIRDLEALNKLLED